MMANELPRHFAAPALGMPRTPRAVSFSIPTSDDLIEAAVPFSQSDAYATVSPVLPRMVSEAELRMQPTVRVGDRAFRKGADVPTKSSLVVFVVIGLFVGLCAFVAMSIALPDSAAPAPAVKTVVAPAKIAAPVVAKTEVAPPPPAAPIVINSPSAADPSTASAKPSAARRRTPTTVKRASKNVTLPANPYGP